MKLTRTQQAVLKKLVVSGVVDSTDLPSHTSLGNVVNRLNSMAGLDYQCIIPLEFGGRFNPI